MDHVIALVTIELSEQQNFFLVKLAQKVLIFTLFNCLKTTILSNFPDHASYMGDYVAVATSGDPIKDYEQLRTEKNVHYRSWILNPKGKSNDGFRIIMRGATHGLQERNLETFTLSSKLETQMPYGLEQLNRKELVFDWIATMARINPGREAINSKLARARIGK